ncbi:putative hydroxymethylbilane synthase, partial [Microsporum audouinii]
SGCNAPIGIETEWTATHLSIRAIVVSLDISQSVEDAIDAMMHTKDESDAPGQALARLFGAGVAPILIDINRNQPSKD